MITIDEAGRNDAATLAAFVEAVQDYERASVPDLKPGAEIAAGYTDLILRTAAERDGVIFLAREGAEPVGFVCAWIEQDSDPLLRDDARRHAYVSDIFVREASRRSAVARMLLDAVEARMAECGCRRIRICAKAANIAALACYQACGYRPYEIVLSKTLTP